MNPTTSEPTKRPTREYVTVDPTRRPTEDQNGSGTGWGQPKPTTKAPKPVKTPRPTPIKTARPTPKPKTPRPTPQPRTKRPTPIIDPKTPRPTNPPRTKVPKPVRTRKPTAWSKWTYITPTPKPTESSNGWGAPNPSTIRMNNEKEQMMAVDGVKETTF